MHPVLDQIKLLLVLRVCLLVVVPVACIAAAAALLRKGRLYCTFMFIVGRGRARGGVDRDSRGFVVHHRGKVL